MSCVMCESYGVQLRPAVGVLVVRYSAIAYDSHVTHDMLPQHQINITSLGCEDVVYNSTSFHTGTPFCFALGQHGPRNPSGPRPSM